MFTAGRFSLVLNLRFCLRSCLLRVLIFELLGAHDAREPSVSFPPLCTALCTKLLLGDGSACCVCRYRCEIAQYFTCDCV
jgi:hypothetical protein